MTRLQLFLNYQQSVVYKIRALANNLDPETAYGEGLDEMAAAIGINPRLLQQERETDATMRSRIMRALEMDQ